MPSPTLLNDYAELRHGLERSGWNVAFYTNKLTRCPDDTSIDLSSCFAHVKDGFSRGLNWLTYARSSEWGEFVRSYSVDNLPKLPTSPTLSQYVAWALTLITHSPTEVGAVGMLYLEPLAKLACQDRRIGTWLAQNANVLGSILSVVAREWLNAKLCTHFKADVISDDLTVLSTSCRDDWRSDAKYYGFLLPDNDVVTLLPDEIIQDKVKSAIAKHEPEIKGRGKRLLQSIVHGNPVDPRFIGSSDGEVTTLRERAIEVFDELRYLNLTTTPHLLQMSFMNSAALDPAKRDALWAMYTESLERRLLINEPLKQNGYKELEVDTWDEVLAALYSAYPEERALSKEIESVAETLAGLRRVASNKILPFNLKQPLFRLSSEPAYATADPSTRSALSLLLSGNQIASDQIQRLKALTTDTKIHEALDAVDRFFSADEVPDKAEEIQKLKVTLSKLTGRSKEQALEKHFKHRLPKSRSETAPTHESECEPELLPEQREIVSLLAVLPMSDVYFTNLIRAYKDYPSCCGFIDERFASTLQSQSILRHANCFERINDTPAARIFVAEYKKALKSAINPFNICGLHYSMERIFGDANIAISYAHAAPKNLLLQIDWMSIQSDAWGGPIAPDKQIGYDDFRNRINAYDSKGEGALWRAVLRERVLASLYSATKCETSTGIKDTWPEIKSMAKEAGFDSALDFDGFEKLLIGKYLGVQAEKEIAIIALREKIERYRKIYRQANPSLGSYVPVSGSECADSKLRVFILCMSGVRIEERRA